MEDLSIKIVTENAKNLSNYDWNNIELLVKKFPSTSNSSHNSNEIRNANYYKSKLTLSPSGDSYITRVLNKDGLCLGFQSITRKDFLYNGKKIESFEFGDVYLDKDLRGQGIFDKMIHDTFKNVKKIFSKSFIYATANKYSQPGLIRGGFKLVDYQLFLKILPLKPYLIFNNIVIQRILKSLNPIYIFLIKKFFIKKSKNIKFSFKSVNNFNDYPNDFFKNHEIELNKSNDYLNWRYIINPHNYKIFLITRDSKYVGYFILREAEYKETPSLFLADLNINRENIKYIHLIFSDLILSNFDIDKFSFIASCVSKKSSYYNNLSFVLPVNYNKIPFIIYQDLVPDNLIDVENMTVQFMLGDGDNI